MIIKIQRPPALADELQTEALISDRSGTFSRTIPLEAVDYLFNEREELIFCKAYLDEDELVIGKKLQPQHF